MKSVMPNIYFFEFTFQSPKRASPIQIDGNLDDWSALHLVPDLMHLKGINPFAKVYFSWDNDNIYLGLSVIGKKKPVDVDAERFWRRDGLEIWLDLRNDKTQRRYSEHCHHFFFLPKGRKTNKELATAGECSEPGSSIQENIFDYEEIEVASVIGRREYSLEARIPRGAIPTYEPIEHPAIGFNYHVNDVDRRAQWWSCGPDFPRHIDPSTWGSVELYSPV
ncbi:hypothetical protein H8E77_23805 [bacterium]|nr:hypothetical protein [bacterium]